MQGLALSDLNSDTLHHAYGIASDNREETAHTIAAWWLEQGEQFVAPQLLSYQTFSVDEARELVKITGYKTGENHMGYIISAVTLTREAQNALLKLFEEPVPGVHFFLVIPSFDILLPTLQSRMQKISVEQSDAESSVSFDAKKFLTDSASGRLAAIEKLLKKATDAEEAKSEITRTVVDAIEDVLATTQNPKAEILETLQIVRKYAALQGASHKILLEYLALNL